MNRKIILAAALALTGFGAGALAHAAAEHREIAGPFATPMEVTRKCLECHADAAHDVMQTSHWTWKLKQYYGQGKQVDRGKMNAVNNFCISINGNWSRCTSCHIGFGWKDANFDFTDSSRIDCLVCHDTTGQYKKPGPAAGMPAGFTGNEKFDKIPVDLEVVARNVGTPTRNNCVVCHGFGGGGNNVKHGDIDSSMVSPAREHDVHMGGDGDNFTCQACHTADKHQIKGNAMVVSPRGENHVSCTDCHDAEPHAESLLNNHMVAPADKALGCLDCHGDNGRLDWQKLGYKGDPMRKKLASGKNSLDSVSMQ